MTIRILVNGAKGRLGRVCCDALSRDERFEWVGQATRGDDLTAMIKNNQVQVVLDVTTPNAVYQNSLRIIDTGAHPVIGTSGLNEQQIASLSARCQENKLGGIIAPNFAIGAVLMMKFAKQAAKYLPNVAIVERHHETKRDAPSGTARHTATAISQIQGEALAHHCQEHIPGCLGGNHQGIPIHSLRLPGIIAEQEVWLSNPGESLRIEHRINDRQCFVAGVLLACSKVMQLQHLVNGLEQLLD